ncbi:MAG: ATP-binding cassette domain-containing protein [Geminicoccaceae bacterium]
MLGQRILARYHRRRGDRRFSLAGGKGKIVWTVGGVLFLVVIDTSLKLLGMSLFVVFAVKGGVILRRDHRRHAPAHHHAGLEMAAEILRLDGLSKSFFGVEVLHAVSFALHRGEILGLVGENGSGKSTTMNILGGIHQADAGSITSTAGPTGRTGPRDAQEAGLAFIHQELNLFENLSDRGEHLHQRLPPAPGRAADRSGPHRSAHARAARMVDVRARPPPPVGKLSQGERQLVEIAKALSQDARIILLDEPTTLGSPDARPRSSSPSWSGCAHRA